MSTELEEKVIRLAGRIAESEARMTLVEEAHKAWMRDNAALMVTRAEQIRLLRDVLSQAQVVLAHIHQDDALTHPEHYGSLEPLIEAINETLAQTFPTG